jgi:O-antigen/teichoic acid export membrane protein
MQKPSPGPHPGPFQMMKVDAESAGILVAVAFFVMGFVSVPIAKGFLVGAFLVGIGVAVVLWLVRKRKNSRPIDARIFDLEERPSAKV